MLTREVVDEAEFERDFPAEPAGYLNVLTRLVLRESRLANLSDGFAKLAPLMKRYIEGVMFTGQASMDERRVMMRLNRGDAKSLLFDVFVTAIRELSIVERESEPTGGIDPRLGNGAVPDDAPSADRQEDRIQPRPVRQLA